MKIHENELLVAKQMDLLYSTAGSGKIRPLFPIVYTNDTHR